MKSKWFTVGIILLFFGTIIIPSTAQKNSESDALTFESKPDLTIVGIVGEYYLEGATLKCVVKNIGTAPSTDSILDTDGYTFFGLVHVFESYNEGEYSINPGETKTIQSIWSNCKISQARVRFNTQIGNFNGVSADLHEIKFHNKDTGNWITPDGNYDQWNLWNSEDDAYDGDINSEASCPKTPGDKYPYGYPEDHSSTIGWFWTPYLVFTFNEPVTCNKLKFHAWYSALHCNRIDIDVFCPGYQEGLLAGQTGL